MYQGKYIFAQLTGFLPHRIFDRSVAKHDGNKYVKSFTCWNQMLCMVFGQLTSRDSMRDLIMSLEGHHSKFYHLGFGPVHIPVIPCRQLPDEILARLMKITITKSSKKSLT